MAPPPPALEAYLGRLEQAPPELLAVTVYHMYMALLRYLCMSMCKCARGHPFQPAAQPIYAKT